MKISTWLTPVVVLATGVSVARADFDVSPSVSGGRVITNAFEDATSTFKPNIRVFDYGFGDDPANPFFTQDPGFHPQPGSGLPAGSSLSINTLSGLSYWNGVGAVAFGPVPAGETLQLAKGSGSLIIDSSPPVPNSLSIDASTPPSGEFDQHLESSLLAPAAADPSSGIYLIEAQLHSSAPAIQDSLPFWILYNNGLDDAATDTTVAFVNANLVPEPASLTMFSIAAVATLRRRRNHRP